MPSVFRVKTAISGGSGSAQLGTMFFEDDGVLTAQHAADAVHDFWDDLSAAISNTYTFAVEGAVDTIDLATGKATGTTAVSVASVPGGGSSPPLPWATQGLIEWRTGFYAGGREVRGRTFLPGMMEYYQTNGVPNAAGLAIFQTAADNLVGVITAQLQVYSRKHTLASGVTGATVWTKWAVLRSRRD